MHLRYFESMYSVISDQTKFKLITTPILKLSLKIEDKRNNFMHKLKNFKLRSDDTYKLLFVTGSGPGVLYGLPKIHKVILLHNFHPVQYLRPIGNRVLVWQNSWLQF